MRRTLIVAAALLSLPARSLADPASEARFDSIVQPYVQSGRFSGAILVVRDGEILFDRAYGMADAEKAIPNRPSTRFHVGTLSMQYTAVAVLHLAETHKLNLDNTAAQFVPGAPAVALRDLLAVAPDSPEAAGDYELLARVAEAATGKSFADVVDAGAFASVWLSGTGLDDGTLAEESRFAKGYKTAGGGRAAADWRALTGAASAYTTTRDELHWLDRFFAGDLVPAGGRDALLEGPPGYGWFHEGQGEGRVWWGEGRAPGYSVFVLRARRGDLSIIVLGNVEGAAAGEIGRGLAATVPGAALPAK